MSTHQPQEMTNTDICVLQLNVEGLTRAKRDLILHISEEKNINIILLQETHVKDEDHLSIEGFNTISFIPSSKHGIATYAREGINIKSVLKSDEGNQIEWISITVNDMCILNIYKPPPTTVNHPDLPSLPATTSTSIVCGDFNSRNVIWGYPDNNPNGETVAQWAENLELHLLYDAKDNKSFFSGRHKKWTNPDLCFVSMNAASSCERVVLDKFPRSGHCPIVITTKVGLKINSLNKKRWNFRKANWAMFTDLTDNLTDQLPDPSGKATDTYNAFTTMLSNAAKASIPRGRRGKYIPCWDEDCELALNAYNTADIKDKLAKSDILMQILNERRRTRWEETVSSIDFTHSSRKAWTTINHLTGRSTKPKTCPVTANSIASVLLKNGKWTDKSKEAKSHSHNANIKIKEAIARQPPTSELSGPITIEHLMDAILCLKKGKAPGIDLVHSEFLCYLGLNALHWLCHFLSNCFETLTIPAVWRQAKVVAILKPKKPADQSESYRPISLLSITYKLMERIILIRINDIVETHLPHSQAGFRRGRSTIDQISRLVHDIETAFQRKEKFGVVYIDLTAAYDTVWHRGLYLKLLQCIPDVKLVKFMMLMLQNRSFYVITSSGEQSRKRQLRNGLPQGSVLAPILFNIYTADIPPTTSNKYIYADDSAIGYTGRTYEQIQPILEADLAILCKYFHKWHLKISVSKTVCSIYHLANRFAKRELHIMMNGKKLKFEPLPVYLGVTLDRSLTFGPHLKNVANKISKRVNLIRKLAGTDWGASFTTLRTSVLALVYSAAEYAAPVWSHSCHTKVVDTILNDAMRLISGTLKPTPTVMLPVLSGIPPAAIRRDQQVLKLAEKADNNDMSLVPRVEVDAPPQRIKRHHFVIRAEMLQSCTAPSDSWVIDRWQEEWGRFQTVLHNFIESPSTTPSGHDLDSRKAWSQLNRLRSGCGRTKHFMKMIGASDDDKCECGLVQTINHILFECPVLSPPNGTEGLTELDNDTINWLQNIVKV